MKHQAPLRPRVYPLTSRLAVQIAASLTGMVTTFHPATPQGGLTLNEKKRLPEALAEMAELLAERERGELT